MTGLLTNVQLLDISPEFITQILFLLTKSGLIYYLYYEP